MDARDFRVVVPEEDEEFLTLIDRCGGWYECPKSENGKRLGPLVAYAGTYAPRKHYVGDIYADCSTIETQPKALAYVAHRLIGRIGEPLVDTFCGMPLGGMFLTAALAHRASRLGIFLEKKVTGFTAEGKEESELIFGRHTVRRGELVILVEDVANNFSTTAKAVDLIKGKGGLVVGIACLLNRSVSVVNTYIHGGEVIPVIALEYRPIPQYRQDEPEVAADVAAGNVSWSPKRERQRLRDAMAKARMQ